MKNTMALLATTIVASLFTLMTGQQSWAKNLAEEIRAQVNETVEKAEKQAEDARSEAAESDVPAGKAVLEIAGPSGTEFSGTCIVGDEEGSIGGDAPQAYTYDLDGRRLECEIRNEGGGDLRIVFDAGNVHSEQSIGSEGAVAELVYDDGIFVTSSSAGSSNQSVIQNSFSSQVISSNS